MPLEIERKFLVDPRRWQLTTKPAGESYRQGYLLITPDRSIRVRLAKDRGFLTIKAKTLGATRPEYEYEIPANDAQELLENFAVSELSKIRYSILFEGKVWVIDEFLGDNEGLMIAEIELEAENEQFRFPGFIGREVTGDEKYYNSNLSINPFKNWKSD